MTKPYRLACIVTHPIQYQAPMFRYLAIDPAINLTVFFLTGLSAGPHYEADFRAQVHWDTPLGGYPHRFLARAEPDHGRSFWLPAVRGLWRLLADGRFDALWVHGYAHQALLRTILYARASGVSVMLRGDSRYGAPAASSARARVKHMVLPRLFGMIGAFLAIGSANRDYYRSYGVPHDRIFMTPSTDPPLLGLLGSRLKRRWNCRLAYNVRDLYPDIAAVNGSLRNQASLRLLAYANRHAFAAADRIIVVGHDMRERLLAKGVAPELVTVIPDWADCTAIKPLRHNRLRDSFGGKFVVMYSGNLGLSQQLETVLAAADRLRGDQRILFVLIGEGARKASLMHDAAARGLPNIRFLPYQPRERLAESLGAADLHLIPLKAGAAGCVVPSKVYGIMAAARPFVAMMEPAAEIARLAIRHDLGTVVPPGDDQALAAALLELMKSPDRTAAMGFNGRQLALRNFERKLVTRRFGEVLDGIAGDEELAPASGAEFMKIPEMA